ncbi:MAG TPA: PEP-CTERM sorting domain-containing protein, partial [Myxococcota bacterium]|nr:PEP-CTERM sorting domain-containing protein [Myxococcota bacterium]
AANATIGIRTQFSLTGGDRVAIPVFFQVEAGVPTPEPHSALLIGLGLAGLAAARKRHGA